MNIPHDIEVILNLFPEVEWDRWAGHFGYCLCFGWIARPDGQRDFLTITFEMGEVRSMSTSSAKFSAEFGRRLFGERHQHLDCKRISETFTGVRRAKS